MAVVATMRQYFDNTRGVPQTWWRRGHDAFYEGALRHCGSTCVGIRTRIFARDSGRFRSFLASDGSIRPSASRMATLGTGAGWSRSGDGRFLHRAARISAARNYVFGVCGSDHRGRLGTSKTTAQTAAVNCRPGRGSGGDPGLWARRSHRFCSPLCPLRIVPGSFWASLSPAALNLPHAPVARWIPDRADTVCQDRRTHRAAHDRAGCSQTNRSPQHHRHARV